MTPDPGDLDRVIRAALEEDLRYGPDVTTAAVIPPGTKSVADVVARQPGTLAGLAMGATVLDLACPAATFTAQARDGDRVTAGDVVARVEGPLAEILTAERTLLNFLTHLSGIATATRAWVDAIDGTGAFVRDTRKTIPGLRTLEKYAVRCGGGLNHRMGLGDAALIKDNHIAAAGGVTAAFRAVLAAAPGVLVEVECDTLDQVGEALSAGAALILLDNMSLDQMRSAVAMARTYPAAKLEASGGLRLENARDVASTGVHYLSIGALTHSSPALDLALDVGLPTHAGGLAPPAYAGIPPVLCRPPHPCQLPAALPRPLGHGKALAALGGYHDLTTIAWLDAGGTVTCRARSAACGIDWGSGRGDCSSGRPVRASAVAVIPGRAYALPSVGAAIRMYRKLFALRTYRRRFTVTLLAFFGATVTVTQLVLWISGVKGGTALAASLITMTPIGIAFALRASLPKADITFRHDSVTAPVRVRIGDIFAPAGSVAVITMNRHFDTAPPWVSADSLVTQLIQREYAGHPSDLRDAMLKEVALNQEAEQPVGEIVRITPGRKTYLLLAVADRHELARSAVAVEAVWSALSRLWQYARLNNISGLRVPVIGSGFARAQVGRVPLLILLLTSYLTAAMEMPICGLEIVLRPDDTDLDLLELVKAYCDILGYHTTDQKPLTREYQPERAAGQ